jgi:hypothetical protein
MTCGAKPQQNIFEKIRPRPFSAQTVHSVELFEPSKTIVSIPARGVGLLRYYQIRNCMHHKRSTTVRMTCAGCAACIWPANGLRWMRWLYMACEWLALDAVVIYGLRMACAGCALVYGLRMTCAGCGGYIWPADDLRWMRGLHGLRMTCGGCGGYIICMTCEWLALDARLVYGLRTTCAGCGGYVWPANDLRWMRWLYIACASRSIASVALLVYPMDDMHSLCMICATASILHRRDESLVEMRKKSVDA